MFTVLKTLAATAGLTAMLALGAQATATAQQTSPCGYWSEGVWVSTPCAAPVQPASPCGYWSSGVWVSTACAPAPPPEHRQAVSGVIVGIDNDMLTLQTGPYRTIAVNDGPALDRMATGHIYRGRMITAYGYWDGEQFVATSIG
jgi:hypothetical protein